MVFCEKCGVSVAGNRTHCPLCRQAVSPAPEKGERGETFPYVPTVYRRYHLLFRMLLFACVVGGVASVAVNLLLPDSGFWSVFVVVGILCLWLILALAIRKRRNIPKGMMYQVFFLSVLCVLWDVATQWSGWSINFVIPILCVAAMGALAVLAFVFKWDVDNMLIYFCIDALFGIVPLLFFLTGCLQVVYPSIICVAVSLISLGGVAVFHGESIAAELRRRLHL